MPHFPLRKTGASLTSFTPSEGVLSFKPSCCVSPRPEEEQDNVEVQSSYRPVQHHTAGKPLCQTTWVHPVSFLQDEVFHITLLRFSPLASRPHADDRAFSEASANEATAFVIQQDNDRVQFSQQQILPREMPSDLP